MLTYHNDASVHLSNCTGRASACCNGGGAIWRRGTRRGRGLACGPRGTCSYSLFPVSWSRISKPRCLQDGQPPEGSDGDEDLSEDEEEERGQEGEEGESDDDGELRGEWYDMDDPFVDDSELVNAERVDCRQTRHVGYFINKGELERTAEQSGFRRTEDPQQKRKGGLGGLPSAKVRVTTAPGGRPLAQRAQPAAQPLWPAGGRPDGSQQPGGALLARPLPPRRGSAGE